MPDGKIKSKKWTEKREVKYTYARYGFYKYE